MIGTPKARFLTSPDAKVMAPVLASATFAATTDAATLQFMTELGAANSIEDAAARNWRREGAVRIIEILKSIAKLPEPPPEPISSTLR